MPPHVSFRQLDSDSEDLYNQDDSRELESDLICVAPCERVEQVERNRAENDADDCGDG